MRHLYNLARWVLLAASMAVTTSGLAVVGASTLIHLENAYHAAHSTTAKNPSAQQI